MRWWRSGRQGGLLAKFGSKAALVATTLLDIEPRLRLVCGYKQMIRLRTALQMT